MAKIICGIYKITNQVNGKCYIGQSINIEKRWKQHRQQAFSVNSICYDSYFYRSIRKYGLENFIFEILEECLKEQLNEKEIFYIAKYHSDNPTFGYNLTPGGGLQGPSTRKLTDEQLEEIFSLLESSNLSQTEIAERYGITQQEISLINQGEIYFQQDKYYPIRTKSKAMKISCLKRGMTKESYCPVCGKIFLKQKDQKFCSSECYKKSKYISRPTREVLKEEIRQNPFTSIGRKYNVTDNAIRKWCDAYHLPRTKKEINSYSEEMWNQI